MLMPFESNELAEYTRNVEPLIQKIPTEFEKFLGNPDFVVLGSVLAMQVSHQGEMSLIIAIFSSSEVAIRQFFSCGNVETFSFFVF